ncbi:MAG: hypothetical protein CMP29_09585 [Roseibacillus sp.]|nr:hypothetical protein [Roseibacillus sp.]
MFQLPICVLLSLGLQAASGELLNIPGLPRDGGSLLDHRFNRGPNEAHFSTGDSGGPGVVFGPNGKPRAASRNLGRRRGTTDSDHRFNGSFGELGISIDASALLPWLQPILFQTP